MSGKSQLTPIIIVSYRTPDDVAACLFSLDALQPESAVSAHICENGGAAEWENLNTALLQPNGPCLADNEIPISLKHDFRRVARLRLRRSGRIVLVGEAKKNLGYAGGINAWLVPLILTADWTGCWFLNPDTRVAPDALARLIRHAARRNLGMVGSRIMATPAATHVSTKGLHWRKTIAKTKAIGQNTSACAESDSKAIEALLDAPSGASCYLTRSCAEALAPLDERYFLYFEDLDWGIRAKRAGYRLGYAHDSVVYHVGGTSTGGDLNISTWHLPELPQQPSFRKNSLSLLVGMDRTHGLGACSSAMVTRGFRLGASRIIGRAKSRNR